MATSSFQRRGARALPLGTEPSRHNGQLLSSVGARSLDAVLGGGAAVGSVVLVREDRHRMYSHTVLKLFLSEGLACGHGLALASADRDPKAVLATLYPQAEQSSDGARAASSSTAPGPAASAPGASGDAMQIAWRYQTAQRFDSEVGAGAPQPRPAASGGGGLGHEFDVSKVAPPDSLRGANVLELDLRQACRHPPVPPPAAAPAGLCDLMPAHAELVERVEAWLEPFAVSRPAAAGERRPVARVVVESLGSPLWPEAGAGMVSTVRVLHRLRAAARRSLAVVLVAMPGHTVPPDVFGRAVHLADAAVGLDAFAGTPLVDSPVLCEYHGFLKVLKLPRLNSLACYLPDTLDLAFKLKRKRFAVERVHLPPDLSDTVSRTQGAAPKHAAAAAAAAAGASGGGASRSSAAAADW